MPEITNLRTAILLLLHRTDGIYASTIAQMTDFGWQEVQDELRQLERERRIISKEDGKGGILWWAK